MRSRITSASVPIAIGLLASLVGGCESRDQAATAGNGAAPAFVPPPTQPPAPLPGQAHAVPLTAYVGRYPRDTIGGVTFFDRTEVANALITAVGDADLRAMIVGSGGVTVPIFRYRGQIGAHGCEPHNCGAHGWTFLMKPDGSAAIACFHDAATMGDSSRWYDNDKPIARPGGCPQA